MKENGDQIYIKIKDPRIAKALGSRASLGNTGAGALMKGLPSLNRFLAATRTSYNPEFMVSNMLRDMEAALGNISEYETEGYAFQGYQDSFPCACGVVRAERNDGQGYWEKEYREFKKMGGMTAFLAIRN